MLIATITDAELAADPAASNTAIGKAGIDGWTGFEWVRDCDARAWQLFAAPAVESFADAPRTLGEARSNRSRSGADWTPRDLLVTMLRDIDSGKQPIEEMVVTWRAGADSGFWNATKTNTTALGLLSYAQLAIGIGDPT